MAQFAAGVDVGGHSIKIVIGRMRMRRVEVVERHEIVIERDEQGHPVEGGVRQALGELMSRVKSRPTLVFSALPADDVLLRTVQVPRAGAKKADAVIGMQIEDDLPIDLDEAVVAHILRAARGAETMDALVAVARQETVREYLELLEEHGLDPAELGAGAAVYTDLSRVMPKLMDDEPELVLDIGCDRTDMLIIEGGEAVSMRTLLIGGADMTRALAAHYRTTFDRAEEYKLQAGWQNLAPVLEPVLARLVQPIRQTLSKHASRTGRRVVKIFTCGGTSLMDGLDQALEQSLGVPVVPLESENPDAAGKEQRDGPFLRAAALAHRSVSVQTDQRFDLRKGPFTYKGQARATRRRWVRAVIAALVLVIGWSFYSLARISSLNARQAAQEQRLAELSERYLGEPVTDFDRAEKLMQSVGPVKSPMPRADAFHFVSEMSRIIPEEIIHDVEKLEIKPGKVQIRGIVDTIAARDEIITRLEEYEECVVAISKGKTTQSPKDNRQKYTLDVETECP